MGWIDDIFSSLQPKDYFTLTIAGLALLVSIYQAVRGYRQHHQMLLKEQADFSATIIDGVYPDGEATPSAPDTLAWLVLENIGDGPAFNVRASLRVDPNHLLGLKETAQGPVRSGETVVLMFRTGTIIRAGRGIDLPEGVDAGIRVAWIDRYGIRRNKEIEFHGLGRRKLTSGESLPVSGHPTGPVGTARWNFGPGTPLPQRGRRSE